MKKTTAAPANKVNGFTLIELLIVIAIIGIISAIAYPAYNQYILKAGRSEGASMLLQVMERQENFYRDNLTYTTDLTALGYSGTVQSETSRYSITAGSCSSGTIARCVLLTATPGAKQAADGNLTLDSRGVKVGNWP